MPQLIKEKQNYGQELFSWDIPEYYPHKRGLGWYFMAGIIILIFLIYAFVSHNFLFAVIILIAAFVIVLHDSSTPLKIKFAITDSGIILGSKFYDYDEIKDFAVLYKQNQDIKKLYFNLKNIFNHRLSISIENLDPLLIKETLLKYLPEDFDRKEEPISEVFARNFKI